MIKLEKKKIRSVAGFLQKYWKFAILGPVFVALDVVCEMLIPRLMQNMVDIGVANSDLAYINEQGIRMIALAAGALICGILNIWFSSKAAMGLGANLRNAIFKKVQTFSFHNIDQFSTASLITRTTSDVNAVQMAVMLGLRLLVRGPLILIAAMYMAIDINRDLAIILFVALPTLAISVGIVLYKAYPLYDRMQQKIDMLNGTVQENLTGIRTVKAFVREDFEKEKFQSANDDLMNNAYRAGALVTWMMPIMIIVVYFAEAAAIWFGGNRIMIGAMGTGALMGFLGYITQVMISLTLIAMAMIFVARSRASTKRILEVLNAQVDIADAPQALLNPAEAPKVEKGKIEFKNLTFHYDTDNAFVNVSSEAKEEDVLKNISFDVKPGQMVAIVGGTGSSKSTLVNLIPRFYDANEGEILIDGHDVREFVLDDLRDGIGMVLQKNVLFSGSIKDNMRWGKADATDEEIIQACKYAQADEFIQQFSDGYDHWIEQGGVNVSGGQRQRLCIARALIKKPRILILDDSTSAVDTVTESHIQDAFRNKLGNMTVLLIAQRINSVQNADKIIVMNEGCIDDMGTHEELLLRNEIYREMNDSQQEGGLA